MLDKLKKFADQAKEKAAPLAEQAAHRAAELASEARVKAGPLAEQARERAVDLAGKAAPAVSQGVDKAAERLDKATGGRYSSKLDKVQGVVHDTASKVATSAGSPTTTGMDGGPATEAEQPATMADPGVTVSTATAASQTAAAADRPTGTAGSPVVAESGADTAAHATEQEPDGS